MNDFFIFLYTKQSTTVPDLILQQLDSVLRHPSGLDHRNPHKVDRQRLLLLLQMTLDAWKDF